MKHINLSITANIAWNWDAENVNRPADDTIKQAIAANIKKAINADYMQIEHLTVDIKEDK